MCLSCVLHTTFQMENKNQRETFFRLQLPNEIIVQQSFYYVSQLIICSFDTAWSLLCTLSPVCWQFPVLPFSNVSAVCFLLGKPAEPAFREVFFFFFQTTCSILPPQGQEETNQKWSGNTLRHHHTHVWPRMSVFLPIKLLWMFPLDLQMTYSKRALPPHSKGTLSYCSASCHCPKQKYNC